MKQPIKSSERRLRWISESIGISLILNFVLLLLLDTWITVLMEHTSLGDAGAMGRFLWESILRMLSYLISFLLPTALLYRLLRGEERERVSWMGKGASLDTPLLTLGVITLNALAAIGNQWLSDVLFFKPSAEILVPTEGVSLSLQLAISLVSLALLPALCEEFLFRGVVLPSLLPYGKGLALLTSGILFGLMHGSFEQLLYSTLTGVALGSIYLRTRSLALCMLIHFLNNGLSVLVCFYEGIAPLFPIIFILGGFSIALLFVKDKRENRLMEKPKREKPPQCWRSVFSLPMLIYGAISVLSAVLVLIF